MSRKKAPPPPLPKITPLCERPEQEKIAYVKSRGWVPVIGGDDLCFWIPQAATTTMYGLSDAIEHIAFLDLCTAEEAWLQACGWVKAEGPGTTRWSDPADRSLVVRHHSAVSEQKLRQNIT